MKKIITFSVKIEFKKSKKEYDNTISKTFRYAPVKDIKIKDDMLILIMNSDYYREFLLKTIESYSAYGFEEAQDDSKNNFYYKENS